jgi:regulator of protease activity HflC (stomatin/prohibitin superfamily)
MDASIYYSVNDPKKFLYRIDGVSALSIMGISSLRVVGAMYTL